MDWQLLFALWERSDQFATAMKRTSRVDDAYNTLWFVQDRTGLRKFQIGEVAYFPKMGCVYFVNGIHRTRVLASHDKFVPLCATADFYRSKNLSKLVVREISKTEPFELPELPIREPGAWKGSDLLHLTIKVLPKS